MTKKFTDLTEKDIEYISRPDLTNPEVCELIGINRIATLTKWRKKLGFKVPDGSKPGRARPWQVVREERECIRCSQIFEVIPSSKKKYCSNSCSSKSMDRSYMKTEKYIKSKSKDTTPEYVRYRNKVHKLSEKTYQENKEIINPNNYPRTLCGVVGGYQLDHIVEIKDGFQKNISPEEMSKVENLRMLTWEENLKRNRKSL